MTHNRRSILTYLGLASAAVAVGAQDLITPVQARGLPTGSDFSPSRAAQALRRLADAIERQDVAVEDVTFLSRLASDDILREEVTFRFVIYDEPPAA